MGRRKDRCPSLWHKIAFAAKEAIDTEGGNPTANHYWRVFIWQAYLGRIKSKMKEGLGYVTTEQMFADGREPELLIHVKDKCRAQLNLELTPNDLSGWAVCRNKFGDNTLNLNGIKKIEQSPDIMCIGATKELEMVANLCILNMRKGVC